MLPDSWEHGEGGGSPVLDACYLIITRSWDTELVKPNTPSRPERDQKTLVCNSKDRARCRLMAALPQLSDSTSAWQKHGRGVPLPLHTDSISSLSFRETLDVDTDEGRIESPVYWM